MIIYYLRTSSKEQNPKLQLDSCNSINKYGKPKIYEEKQSAFKDNVEREEFKQIKKLIQSGKVKHFYVWDLDRIFRDRKKLISFFEFCKMYGCKIHSFRQGWLEELHKIPEPFDEIMHSLMLQIMGWLAEEESKKKGERVSLAVRKQEGKPTKSYKGNLWGRKALSKNTINEVLKLNKKGLSIREISNNVFYWDKNNNKKKISKSAVHKILKEKSTNKSSFKLMSIN